MARVTQADIARAAGCDPAQVSRALAGAAGVAADTRRRILAAAQDLGYRADPALSALAQERWAAGGRRLATIALIHPAPRHDRFAPTNPRVRRLVRTATTVARQFGYQLLELRRSAFADDAAVEHFLQQRVVTGIIVGFHRDPAPLNLTWERYATVTIGGEASLPGMHRIATDYAHALGLAVDHARAVGYRRFGFCCYRYGNQPNDDAVLAQILLHRWRLVEAGLPRLTVFRFRDEDAQAFNQWYHHERPDCLIATNTEPYTWLQECGVRTPRDCGFIHLLGRGRPDEPDLTCVDRRHEDLGRQAVHLLHQLLQHRQYGPARFPITHLVSAAWHPGTTIRAPL